MNSEQIVIMLASYFARLEEYDRVWECGILDKMIRCRLCGSYSVANQSIVHSGDCIRQELVRTLSLD